MNIQTDIIILGGGIAALQAARKLSTRFEVHIITKSDITMSSSYKAQGGIAAVVADHDSTMLHVQDTLVAGEFHHHEDNVKVLVEKGATVVKTLLQSEFPADRTSDGNISLGLEGAHSRSRIIHAGGDATGKNMIYYYLNSLPKKIHLHTHEFAYELILNSAQECCGVRVKTAQGEKTYFASYIILATGGAGALYECTSNCANSYGDGIALAYLAGAAITDMEFVQFHPSLLYVNGARGLVSEAVRGAGGRFVDEHGQAIMDGKHPLGDLAPRHITAYEMYKMRAQEKPVYIDITNIEHFEQNFPTITKLCHDNGVNLAHGKIPVAPGSHFLMGGVIANTVGETTIPRLLAVGEVACTGVHGANRLASNSLLEGMAFGELMAENLLKYGTAQSNFVLAQPQPKNSLPSLMRKEDLQREMLANVGIVRSQKGLETLLKKLPALHVQPNVMNKSREEIELLFMHITAALITNAALTRTESRGAHIRVEMERKDQRWEKQWIVFQQGTMNVRNRLYEHNQAKTYAPAIF
ncbi:L-aspartate oxidase [Lysinibacillus sp. KU-BSD001]|uniref:L-aspartate oxidase n=1 Tax=Lysinibacillus sp. KU-BSD001 TaxID=3141328 RepID=UPI0036E26E7C